MAWETGAHKDFEREKWEADVRLREREIAAKEREQETKAREAAAKECEQEIRHQEVQAKVEELRRSRWVNPLMLAIAAASLAAVGNAGVALINGIQQRAQDERHATAEDLLQTAKDHAEQQLEEGKAEAARILEVIRTNDPDKAAVNLGFLLDTGLIVSEERKKSLAAYLSKRLSGQGPALPSSTLKDSVFADVKYLCSLKSGNAASVISALDSALKAVQDASFQYSSTPQGIVLSDSEWMATRPVLSFSKYEYSTFINITDGGGGTVQIIMPLLINARARDIVVSVLGGLSVDPSCVGKALP